MALSTWKDQQGYRENTQKKGDWEQASDPEEIEEAFAKQKIFTACSQAHSTVEWSHAQKQNLVEDT